jgi:hypothetical protein
LTGNLRISEDLTLPPEAITQTFGILAKRGVGKTYTASVMTEEMLKAQLPVVVCDPIGVWWGLRSSVTGKSAGLPIIVLGGDHGDAPLEETAGSVIADLVVDERVSLVLDLSLFRKAGQVRFMTDFAERLYQRNRQPLHLMLDEADAFAPQRPMKGAERLLGAMEDLVRRGRARGLGMTLISQRPAVLNKNVLTQIEVLVTLRMVSPQDRAAIDAWVQVHGEPEQREQLMASLPSLPIGTAWFWSPGWLDLFQRVQIRERETFDSSATPEMGAEVEPRKMAAVDLGALQERMAATLERAKAEDPKRLQRRIRELEAKIDSQEPERVEVPVLTDEAREALGRAATAIDDAQRAMIDAVAEASQQLSGLLDRLGTQAAPPNIAPRRARVSAAPPPVRPRSTPRAQRATPPPDDDVQIKAGAVRMLRAAASLHPMWLTRSQLGALAKVKHSGGTFSSYLSSLRTAGLIEEDGANVRTSQAGFDYLGEDVPAPATTDEILALWRPRLKAGAGRMLDALLDVYPDSMTREELSEQAGVTASGGTFSSYLSMLRTAHLIDEDGGLVRAGGVLYLNGSTR